LGWGQTCQDRVEDFYVRGNSLSGIVEPDQHIRARFGFYDCHSVSRGDLVLLRYAGNRAPVLKVVRGVPGDRFSVSAGAPGELALNGAVATNAQGVPFFLDARARRMLALYEHDYGGVIPGNAYLLLGNQPSGSVDARRFGLVAEREILAKVELP
jgi:signal peptidase I